jgi:aromatic ring-opening dioxygenase catalytic subunit (LigB family)
MGRALAPLREKGVLLLGSGNTYHGRGATAQESLAFDEHLRELAVAQASGERERDLREWASHPCARKCCGGGPEHLLPLIVMAGAATPSLGVVSIPHDFMGSRASHFLFQ